MAKKASSKKAKVPAKKVKKAKKGVKAVKAVKKTSARRSPGKPAAKKPAAKKPAAKKKKKATKPAKARLSRSELKGFRGLLLEKRADLVGDMNGAENESLRTSRQDGTGDLSNLPTHPADIGTDNYEQEFTLGLLESERILLAEIDEALERIEAGTFGICLGTHKPISKPRLRARPWAKYCIEYARLVKQGLVDPDQASEDDDEDE